VADIVHELESYGCEVHAHDPVADGAEAQHEYGIKLESWDSLPKADAMIVAVPHKEVLAHSLLDFEDKLNAGGCFIDVKSQFDPKAIKEAGFCVWRL
jgi:UDP-N-acetyl-D-galactosamine dehydrogenase